MDFAPVPSAPKFSFFVHIRSCFKHFCAPAFVPTSIAPIEYVCQGCHSWPTTQKAKGWSFFSHPTGKHCRTGRQHCRICYSLEFKKNSCAPGDESTYRSGYRKIFQNRRFPAGHIPATSLRLLTCWKSSISFHQGWTEKINSIFTERVGTPLAIRKDKI